MHFWLLHSLLFLSLFLFLLKFGLQKLLWLFGWNLYLPKKQENNIWNCLYNVYLVSWLLYLTWKSHTSKTWTKYVSNSLSPMPSFFIIHLAWEMYLISCDPNFACAIQCRLPIHLFPERKTEFVENSSVYSIYSMDISVNIPMDTK